MPFPFLCSLPFILLHKAHVHQPYTPSQARSLGLGIQGWIQLGLEKPWGAQGTDRHSINMHTRQELGRHGSQKKT